MLGLLILLTAVTFALLTTRPKFKKMIVKAGPKLWRIYTIIWGAAFNPTPRQLNIVWFPIVLVVYIIYVASGSGGTGDTRPMPE